VNSRGICGLLAQLRDRAVRDLVYDTSRDGVERFFLLCGQGAQPRSLPVDLTFTPKLQLFL
jgi:hypothetical protein